MYSTQKIRGSCVSIILRLVRKTLCMVSVSGVGANREHRERESDISHIPHLSRYISRKLGSEIMLLGGLVLHSRRLRLSYFWPPFLFAPTHWPFFCRIRIKFLRDQILNFFGTNFKFLFADRLSCLIGWGGCRHQTGNFPRINALPRAKAQRHTTICSIYCVWGTQVSRISKSKFCITHIVYFCENPVHVIQK
jgi:hypothetical protein